MGSGDSSNDDVCFCGHKRSEHFDPSKAGDYSGCKAVVGTIGGLDGHDDCVRFRLAPPLGWQTVGLHHYVPAGAGPGDGLCQKEDCRQPSGSSVHAVLPLGGQTVTEGQEQGQVCTGPTQYGAWKGHRPMVRGKDGRCYLCEPLTMPEAIDSAEEMDICELPHETTEEEDACYADGRFSATTVSICYAVEGGQQYTLQVSAGTHVIVEDGIVQILNARPALGIVSVHTR